MHVIDERIPKYSFAWFDAGNNVSVFWQQLVLEQNILGFGSDFSAAARAAVAFKMSEEPDVLAFPSFAERLDGGDLNILVTVGNNVITRFSPDAVRFLVDVFLAGGVLSVPN